MLLPARVVRMRHSVCHDPSFPSFTEYNFKTKTMIVAMSIDGATRMDLTCGPHAPYKSIKDIKCMNKFVSSASNTLDDFRFNRDMDTVHFPRSWGCDQVDESIRRLPVSFVHSIKYISIWVNDVELTNTWLSTTLTSTSAWAEQRWNERQAERKAYAEKHKLPFEDKPFPEDQIVGLMPLITLFRNLKKLDFYLRVDDRGRNGWGYCWNCSLTACKLAINGEFCFPDLVQFGLQHASQGSRWQVPRPDARVVIENMRRVVRGLQVRHGELEKQRLIHSKEEADKNHHRRLMNPDGPHTRLGNYRGLIRPKIPFIEFRFAHDILPAKLRQLEHCPREPEAPSPPSTVAEEMEGCCKLDHTVNLQDTERRERRRVNFEMRGWDYGSRECLTHESLPWDNAYGRP